MASRKYNKTNEAAQAASVSAGSVVIAQPNVFSVALEVEGTSPLIQNNFSQKAMEQMLRKHMGITVQREPKVPSKCIEAATTYNVDHKICIPPTAFKKGMLSASTLIKGFKKTQLRIQLYVEGNSIPITYSRMEPRIDIVKTSGMNRTPDIRFRPSFHDWKARLVLQFSEMLRVQSVVDLLNRAGNSGVGEWRPEKDGTFGTYRVVRHISDPKEVAEVRDICRPTLVPLVIPPWAMDVEMSPEILSRIAAGNDAPPDDEEGAEDAGGEDQEEAATDAAE